MKPPKIIYEWVFTMNKGDDLILTEKQYQFYSENHKESRIAFTNFEFNPMYVVSSIRRPARIIRRDFPCPDCHGGGRNKENSDWCSSCEGSGVKLPEKK